MCYPLKITTIIIIIIVIVSKLTRRRVNRQSITASVANDVTTELQCKGFGSVEKVKIGRTKPVNVFFQMYT